MSDFDKEAERERLREKYEGESEDREQTQRMSQLLLQGATMTNKHCDACGSPVFRHDGQEFCPECHDGGADTAAEDDAEGVDADGPSGGGARSSEPADRQPGTGVASPDENSRSPGDGESRSDGREGPLRAAPDREQTDADLGEARASLVRTLATMARRAEATDDPRRAKELLGAAREAAEAIAALDS